MIEQQWEKFRQAVIPQYAPKVQVSEMKKAYLAGTIDMMHILMKVDDSISDDDGAKLIESLYEECVSMLAGEIGL